MSSDARDDNTSITAGKNVPVKLDNRPITWDGGAANA